VPAATRAATAAGPLEGRGAGVRDLAVRRSPFRSGRSPHAARSPAAQTRAAIGPDSPVRISCRRGADTAGRADGGATRSRAARARALLQSFVQNPEARAIPRQDLETVPASIPKEKEMARERVERQLLANQRGESINRPPQIGGAGRQIDPHGGRERQHAVRKTSSTRRTMSAEALARIRTRSPLAKMTSRSPPPRSALVTT